MQNNEIRDAAIEQLMRMTPDEALVARLASSAPPETVLGRLSQDLFDSLVPGSPLLTLAGGPLPHQEWRDLYPPSPGSLYATLEFFRSMESHVTSGNAYTELLERRRRLDFPLEGPMLDL